MSFAQSREYKIKAEFLQRFTRFIEWPEVGNAHFRICVIGANPFGTYLRDSAHDIRILGKSVQVVNLSETSAVLGCDLLYIDKSQASNLSGIITLTAGKPILTIADTDGFAKEGVLINFYNAGAFIRFEINQTAAQNSGLRFSSRLLKLARLIK
jgi:uncharacterized protein DUF4154